MKQVIGCTGIIICFIATPVLAQFLNEKTGWILVLGCIMIMGISTSIFQNGIFGFAGILPSKYISALMVGNGVSGILLVAFRAFTVVTLPTDETKGRDDMNSFYGCLIFFGGGLLLLIITMFSTFYIYSTNFAKHYIQKATSGSSVEGK